MRKPCSVLVKSLLAIFFMLLGSSITAAKGLDWTLQLNENRGNWTSNHSAGKGGVQNLLYYSLGFQGENYGLLYLGSHSETSYLLNNPTVKDLHITTFLDSTLSGFYRRSVGRNSEIRVGLDINLPTGKPAFHDEELSRFITDRAIQDLNLVSAFGRGLDFGPNIIFSHAFSEKWISGIGGRYQLTGGYNDTIDTPNDNFNPGDEITLFLSNQVVFTEKRSFFIDIRGTMIARDHRGGAEVFKQGDLYDATIRWIDSWRDFRGVLGAVYAMQAKNQSLGSGALITTEDRNSNNNRYEVFFNLNRPWKKSLTFNGTIRYKNVFGNGYEVTSSLYDGGYDKTTIGGGINYDINSKVAFTSDLRFFRLHNGEDSQETLGASYDGYNIDLGFVYSF